MTDDQFKAFMSEILKIREAMESVAGLKEQLESIDHSLGALSDCIAPNGERPYSHLSTS